MIRVERHDVGFRIDAEGLSGADRYELDVRAVRTAIDRYLADRERLYASPPSGLENTTLWLVYALGRCPNTWTEFHVYFLLARLRILLARNPRPVECPETMEASVRRAIRSLCEEHDVEVRSRSPDSTTSVDESGTTGGRFGRLGRSVGRLTGAGERLRSGGNAALERAGRWFLVCLFAVARPFVLALYFLARRPVDVRFWLHPTESHRARFFGAPTDLENRGRRVGYALYDVLAVTSVRGFVRRGIRAVRTAFDPTEPIHVEWYAPTSALLGALRRCPSHRDAIQRAGSRFADAADSPEASYLARQVESVSLQLVFHLSFAAQAIRGFGAAVGAETWTHARSPTKLTSRLLARSAEEGEEGEEGKEGKEGKEGEQSTVAVAPHYFAETRINARFTETETHGREAMYLPDICAVFEPRSGTTLRQQSVPTRTVVARDKVEREAGTLRPDVAGNGDVARTSVNPDETSAAGVSPPDGDRTRVLVVLDLPVENAELVDALREATRHREDVTLVFKPHPFYPPADGLFDGLDSTGYEVSAPDASLADLVASCDVCLSMYSTAAFPALVRGLPVVWAPFASPGHIRMDLMDEVGIRVDDAADLADALDGLVSERDHYVEVGRACAEFAAREIVPDEDAPPLAQVLENELPEYSGHQDD